MSEGKRVLWVAEEWYPLRADNWKPCTWAYYTRREARRDAAAARVKQKDQQGYKTRVVKYTPGEE